LKNSAALHLQIENFLAARIPSALSPRQRIESERIASGVAAWDELLQGGLPVGVLTEFVGAECSGRTTMALAYMAAVTRGGSVCAWIDVANALDPEAAAANGVDLERLLWVRCGVAARTSEIAAAGGASLPVEKKSIGIQDAPIRPFSYRAEERQGASHSASNPWSALDQALRATDLLLQGGGFSAIILDLGSTPAEFAWRIPLATWFRFRAACERTRVSLLLLTQHPCARSSAELVVRMEAGSMEAEGKVMTGIRYRAEVERQRLQQRETNVVSIRKPPQSERPGQWRGNAAWAQGQ